MSGALAGRGILVTRPEHQAGPLCRLIEAEGGTPVRLPVIDIRPNPERAAVRAAVGPIDRYDIIIFVSANAVRYGAELLQQKRDLPIAAIGAATAAALNAAGYRVAIGPAPSADSEGLLSLPPLQHLARGRVLIVRGDGGRELLADTLAARGATVTYAEVYSRATAVHEPEALAQLEALWRQGAIWAYTATSVELLERLIAILPPTCRELLHDTRLVTGTARVSQAATELGVGSPILLASGPDDRSLVDALVEAGRHTSR